MQTRSSLMAAATVWLGLAASLAAAQKPYRLANCYSFSAAIYPLDLQAIYADNTLEGCANSCAVFGYTFFGVSDGTNCYCGNSVYDDITSPECFGEDSESCPGAPFERCGGRGQMAIYGDPALIGDCPATPVPDLGGPCSTVLAGATPSGAPSSSVTLAPSTADRSGSIQTPSVTDGPSASASSYILTTDSNGSPTLVPTSLPEASRTGSQDASVTVSQPAGTADGTSPATSGGLYSSAIACSPTTLRSALVDSRGRTVSVFPAGATPAA